MKKSAVSSGGLQDSKKERARPSGELYTTKVVAPRRPGGGLRCPGDRRMKRDSLRDIRLWMISVPLFYFASEPRVLVYEGFPLFAYGASMFVRR